MSQSSLRPPGEPPACHHHLELHRRIIPTRFLLSTTSKTMLGPCGRATKNRSSVTRSGCKGMAAPTNPPRASLAGNGTSCHASCPGHRSLFVRSLNMQTLYLDLVLIHFYVCPILDQKIRSKVVVHSPRRFDPYSFTNARKDRVDSE